MSLVEDSGTGHFDCQVMTLEDLMGRLGHEFVDLVKIDIEGAEYNLLRSWIDRRIELPIGQMWIEFHPYRAGRSKRDTLTLLTELKRSGRLCLNDDADGYLLLSTRRRRVSMAGWVAACLIPDLRVV